MVSESTSETREGKQAMGECVWITLSCEGGFFALAIADLGTTEMMDLSTVRTSTSYSS